MRASTPGARKSFPAGSTELIRAVERRLGLQLRAGVHWRLLERARELMLSGKTSSHEDMIARVTHASDHDPVVCALREAASIGETFFFRAPQQLRRLEKIVQTHLIEPKRKQGNSHLRVWSVACATGEEAYSLAILFKSVAPDFNIQVVGTDMNEAALQKARLAVYRGRALRQVSPAQLKKWFRPAQEGWSVNDMLRSCVSFATLNLVTDSLPAAGRKLYGFDVLVCRNVLIYLDTDEIPGVMERLGKCANATSVLVLTPAEYSAARYARGFETLSSGILIRSASVAPSRPKPRHHPPPAALRIPAPPAAVSSPPRDEVPAQPPGEVAENLRRAREAADAGAFDLAEQHLAHVLRLEPDSAQTRYLRGVIAMARGDITAAIREYRQALYLRRGFVAAELGLGLALARAGGKTGEAHQHLERALALLRPLPEDAMVEGLEQPALVARGLAAQVLGEGP